ncbi:MAG TPA: DegT/DnrJ/EryC1/StrS family aminotransferase [Solirubrobacteraceae bacterium]
MTLQQSIQHTGAPVPFVRLDQHDPELFEQLMAAVRDVAGAGAFTMGRHLDLFEADFAAYCDTDHAIGVSSGTEALTLTLRALEIGPGDEVIVPANSFIATAEAVSAAGATPRLVDVDPETLLLTAELAAEALNPKVRCIIPVHLYGRTVDMEPMAELARSAGVKLVEDACQAHGAVYRGRKTGALGDAGCFSFYPTKNLGAWGDGGAVTTDDAELADRIRLLRSHGERPRYNHRVVGTTARLDALQAAILRVKLGRLDEWSDLRRTAAAALRLALQGSGVELPAVAGAGEDHVYHLFVVQCDDRDALRAGLDARGVASAIHYPTPIHRTGAYKGLGLEAGSLPVAEEAAGRICSLPMFPGITPEEIEAVADAVKETRNA